MKSYIVRVIETIRVEREVVVNATSRREAVTKAVAWLVAMRDGKAEATVKRTVENVREV